MVLTSRAWVGELDRRKPATTYYTRMCVSVAAERPQGKAHQPECKDEAGPLGFQQIP